MKRILISCLLGIGLLLPALNAKSNFISAKKIINVFIEGYVLFASSDTKTGTLQHIDIYDADMQELLYTQKCGSSNCQVDLTKLPSGNYEAEIYAANGTQLKAFSL